MKVTANKPNWCDACRKNVWGKVVDIIEDRGDGNPATVCHSCLLEAVKSIKDDRNEPTRSHT
jgi:hypothetical protein